MRSYAGRMAAVLACAVALLAGCGEGESGGDVLSGSVTDGAGDGLPGAVIVVGPSSTTLFADSQGRFGLGPVTGDALPIRILSPGYRSRSMQITPGQSEVRARLDEDPAPQRAPTVTIDSLTAAPEGLAVSATIVGAPGRTIVDARAEILGTPDGVVLTRSAGDVWTGTVATAESSGTVMVFAVDDEDRHGEDVRTFGGNPSGGSWTGDAECWAGSMYGNDRGRDGGGRYHFNFSLDVAADGSCDALAGFLRLARLRAGFNPLVTSDLAGSARVVGRNYRIELSDATGATSLTLMGTVAEDGGTYTGFANGRIADNPYQANFVLVNTGLLGSPWTAGALAHLWGASFFYGNQSALAPGTYQYNVLLGVDAGGAVAPGAPTTLGATTAGGMLAFADVAGRNLGYFTGSPGLTLGSGAAYDLTAFMAVGRRRFHGVWSSGGPSCGTFWGRRNPAWSLANLDAQWQGSFVVTEGPDTGQVLNAQVTINSNGEVTGTGSIVAPPGGSLTGGNVTIGDGSLSFADASVGALVGSFAGSQQGAPVAVNMSTPALPETASMGVYHGRMVGKFSISSNGDAGYYFLFRNSRN